MDFNLKVNPTQIIVIFIENVEIARWFGTSPSPLYLGFDIYGGAFIACLCTFLMFVGSSFSPGRFGWYLLNQTHGTISNFGKEKTKRARSGDCSGCILWKTNIDCGSVGLLGFYKMGFSRRTTSQRCSVRDSYSFPCLLLVWFRNARGKPLFLWSYIWLGLFLLSSLILLLLWFHSPCGRILSALLDVPKFYPSRWT